VTLWTDDALGQPTEDYIRSVTVGVGGLIVAAHWNIAPSNAIDTSLVAHSQPGATKWTAASKEFGVGVTQFDRVVALKGGEFAAVGRLTCGPGPCARSLVVNANGWHKWETLGRPTSAYNDAAPTPDGGFVAVGYYSTNPLCGLVTAWSINKTADALDKEYCHPAGKQRVFHVVAVDQASGGYWVVGQAHPNGGKAYVEVLRLDAKGTVVSIVEVNNDGKSNSAPYRVLPLGDGKAAVAGRGTGPNGGDDAMLFTVDGNKAIAGPWYFGSAGDDNFYDVVASGSSYVAVGVQQPGAGLPYNALLMHIAQDGKPLAKQLWLDAGSEWKAMATVDGARLALGGTFKVKSKGVEDRRLAVCDLYGSCDCGGVGGMPGQAARGMRRRQPLHVRHLRHSQVRVERRTERHVVRQREGLPARQVPIIPTSPARAGPCPDRRVRLTAPNHRPQHEPPWPSPRHPR
jgi:hypothetical protein